MRFTIPLLLVALQANALQLRQDSTVVEEGIEAAVEDAPGQDNTKGKSSKLVKIILLDALSPLLDFIVCVCFPNL